MILNQIIKQISLFTVLSVNLMLSACGGGGGGSAIPSNPPETPRLVTINPFGSLIVSPNATTQYGFTAYYSSSPGTSFGYPPEDATWSSSDPSIATINKFGVATAGANNGSTSITVTFRGISASTLLSVKTPVSLAVAMPNGQTSIVTVPLSNQALVLDAIMSYSDGTTQVVDKSAEWSSSDTSVGTIWNNNGVMPRGVGTTTITAKKDGFSGTIDVTVTPPPVPTSISINGLTSSSGVYAKRTRMGLSATFGLSSGGTAAVTNAVWSSSDTNVFTVDANGAFVGTGGGTALLTVTAGGLSASKTIMMVDPVAVPSVIVSCNASTPMTLSAATWNSNYTADPTNITEWVTVDAATCYAFPYVVLVVTGAPTTNQYSILQAPRYSTSVFGPAITSTSTMTPQLSSGTAVTVGYKPTASSFYYAPVYTISAQ
jgi:hypothetical protein